MKFFVSSQLFSISISNSPLLCNLQFFCHVFMAVFKTGVLPLSFSVICFFFLIGEQVTVQVITGTSGSCRYHSIPLNVILRIIIPKNNKQIISLLANCYSLQGIVDLQTKITVWCCRKIISFRMATASHCPGID